MTKPTRGKSFKVRLDDSLASKLVETFEEEQTLARNETRLLCSLEEEIGQRLVRVPELEADVHDLRGLKLVGEALLEAAGSEPRRRA